ncbi:hypothetical protein A9W99_11230 [Mycobacterium sp. 1164966.3]|uniref:hypothetical protein n=1 Tax=Mycobacterium sp. 1164966.3 TaxID=1856861 RepID=UPI000800A6C3|nr:hypothetical protein [Mycobacterium sp. 1164966.3]OBA82676.1 hypothetical protein A9W99_11230 [Mycobacterium sp. 1164966.3]
MRGCALQFPTATSTTATLDEAPAVNIRSDVNLTTDQARELAALIVATADELDGCGPGGKRGSSAR